MRIAFISDLHGNLPALDAVLTDIDGRGVDEVICLGDIVDLGPQPGEVLELLRARDIPCIGGNHDPLDENPRHEMLGEVEDWTRERLSEAQHAWLDELPFAIEREAHGHTLLGVHASPRKNTENMDGEVPGAELANMLEGHDHDVVVCGHTHAPLIRRVTRHLLVNIGSVGLAFEETFRGGTEGPWCLPFAEYGIVDLAPNGVSATLLRVDYELAAYVEAVHASGMPRAEQWLSHFRDS